MTDRVDVVIAGAGPAGAHCARLLSRRGLSVTLVERHRLPRYKACGGGLPVKALRLLDIDVSAALEVEVREALVTCCGNRPVVIKYPAAVGWMVMRDTFDHILADGAADAGARICEGETVRTVAEEPDCCRIETTRRTLRADYLIGADGANSTVARTVAGHGAVKKEVAVAGEIFVSPADLERQGPRASFDFGAVPDGYSWIFPKKDHFSIGLYSSGERLSDLKRRLVDFIGREPVLRNYSKLTLRGHLLPRGDELPLYGTKRIFLCGDAGGMVDPFFGEGIYYALKSASIATEELCRRMAGDSDERVYTVAIKEQIGRDLAYARMMAMKFYRSVERYYGLMENNPAIQKAFTGIITGEYSFRECFFKSLLALPFSVLPKRGPSPSGGLSAIS
ncbi:MAG: geranylgeranyl reductase family protein [Deltaproteobacteria bacterium]|nr:geranylgeranyl reductase family protein [Deltaproteobacteria bacterium]